MPNTPTLRDSQRTSDPSQIADGTINGRILDSRHMDGPDDFGFAGTIVRVALPLQLPSTNTTGRYFLVRCGINHATPQNLESRQHEWSIYARRALFSVGPPTSLPNNETAWEFLLPARVATIHTGVLDYGYSWLRRLPEHSTINLIGPLGNTPDFAPHHRTLIVVADTHSLAYLLPAIHAMLDRGGRVALVWVVTDPPPPGLLNRLPIPVEVHLAHSAEEWQRHLAETLRWGDCLYAALSMSAYQTGTPSLDYHTLAHLIRSQRYRLEPGYAHALVMADLVCGYGACLACVVPTPDGGQTRACLHGPLMPLEAIAR
jgi:NAD(P)H-flavin reductase